MLGIVFIKNFVNLQTRLNLGKKGKNYGGVVLYMKNFYGLELLKLAPAAPLESERLSCRGEGGAAFSAATSRSPKITVKNDFFLIL